MGEIDEATLKRMRAASYMLPAPGDDVVRECLDEIERLRGLISDLNVKVRKSNSEIERLHHQLSITTKTMDGRDYTFYDHG